MLVTLLCGCAARAPVLVHHLPPAAAPVVLAQTPFFPQERYQCGPAALAMVLQASGVEVRPRDLVDKVYIPALQGSLQAEIIAAARSYGRVPYVIAPGLDALLAEIEAGRPVLVLENLGWGFYPLWHYAVVIGYLPTSDQLVLRSGTTKHKLLAAETFVDNWAKADHWGLVLLRPGALPAGGEAARYLQAALGVEQSGQLDGAARAYAAATRRWPQAAAAWFGLGNSRYALGAYADAERAYRRAAALRPQDAAVRNNLAQTLARQGCLVAARDQIARALASAPPNLRAAIEDSRGRLTTLAAGQPHCRERDR